MFAATPGAMGDVMQITMDTGELQTLKDQLGHIRQMNTQLRKENDGLRKLLQRILVAIDEETSVEHRVSP